MERYNNGEGFNTGMAAEQLKTERAEIMAQIDAELTAIDDHSAAQRNLPL